jgi:hypothetical protein
MLIGRMEETILALKIGYKTLFKPKTRILNFVYGGILGEQSYFTTEIITDELINSLKRGEADAVFLEPLQLELDVRLLARTKPPFLCRDHIPVTNIHWKMNLPDTIDKFLKRMSRGRRHEIRRYPKVLEKNYPGKVTFSILIRKDEVDKICRDVEEIAQKTYQRGIGVGFVNNEENQRRLALLD